MGDACPSAAVGASDLQPTPASHLAACLQRYQPLSGPPLCPLAVGTFPRASGQVPIAGPHAISGAPSKASNLARSEELTATPLP